MCHRELCILYARMKHGDFADSRATSTFLGHLSDQTLVIIFGKNSLQVAHPHIYLTGTLRCRESSKPPLLLVRCSYDLILYVHCELMPGSSVEMRYRSSALMTRILYSAMTYRRLTYYECTCVELFRRHFALVVRLSGNCLS